MHSNVRPMAPSIIPYFMLLLSFIFVLNGTITPRQHVMLKPIQIIVDHVRPFGKKSNIALILNSEDDVIHFTNNISNMLYDLSDKLSDGNITEFISISPDVSFNNVIRAIAAIINVPTIFGMPKNWLRSAPLPASIIEEDEIKYKVINVPVILLKKFGLTVYIRSL